MSADVLAFGPFQFDTKTRHLTRDGEQVVLNSRQADLLLLLVSKPRFVFSKDLLIEAAWRDVAVTDNSVEQAISGLRRLLTPDSGDQYIETLPRRGYRFVADVTRVERRESDDVLESLLAPHRAWIEGRAALETLEREQIDRAQTVFAEVLQQVSDQASAHVGLANARAMQFEMTRSDVAPNTTALADALRHAREACRLDPSYGEAWATLGFVLERTGAHADALAAARRAVTLEPDNWRHHVRLSYASWGEERLRAARRALALLPGFPLAHWLVASVYVARQALAEAARELTAGIDVQQKQEGGSTRFSGVALHWLLGLLHLANGDDERAMDEFRDELAHEASGHLYARECCANTSYAIGAVEWRRGHHDLARRAFAGTLARVPGHRLAQIAIVALDGGTLPSRTPGSESERSASTVDAAIARATAAVFGGDHPQAAHWLDVALADTPPGSAGWILPVDPLLQPLARPALWSGPLTRLRLRAA